MALLALGADDTGAGLDVGPCGTIGCAGGCGGCGGCGACGGRTVEDKAVTSPTGSMRK
jgi:hypothetical protein